MKTIIIFNQKGGVGKTSTVANLMAEFTALKKRVIALDLDAQGNLTRFLGIKTQKTNTLRELLLELSTFDETVQKTQYGDVVPCDDALTGELLRFATMPAFVLALKNIVDSIKKRYDICLIDCPPSVNQVTSSALIASDYVIIPTEVEYFSASGVAQIAETLRQVKKLNAKIEVLGLLLIKYNAQRTLTKTLEDELETATKNIFNTTIFNTKIRCTVDVPCSQALGQSVRDYKKESNATLDYGNLAKEILERIGAKN